MPRLSPKIVLCNSFLYTNNIQKHYSVSRCVISIVIVIAPTHHNSSTHKTLSQNCLRSKQSVADNGQQNMNGDWNLSNNLKKTCSKFTLAIEVKRKKDNGFGDF